MRLRHKACVALVCFTCAQPGVAAEWAPTWAIEGDPTLSKLASKSELDACIGRRVQDLETLVELSTYAPQRSNARPADANERLALQTEQRRQKGSGG